MQEMAGQSTVVSFRSISKFCLPCRNVQIKNRPQNHRRKAKSPNRFGLKELCVLLEDGTEISDDAFLFSLKPHSLLTVAAKNEIHTPVHSKLAEAIENTVRAIEALRKFKPNHVEMLLNEDNGKRIKSAVKWISGLPRTKAHYSSKAEHPEWFEGCNKLVNSKEEYFRKCAQGRIRSYLRDAKSKLLESVISTRIIIFFQEGLASHCFFSCYFDRSTTCHHRICDYQGQFQCQGKYNQDLCHDLDHQINPYDNAESRILFTTWNLDHVIERRNILSSMQNEVNVKCDNECFEKYFSLLFTLKNLKLVHKNCHVIGPHENSTVIHEH